MGISSSTTEQDVLAEVAEIDDVDALGDDELKTYREAIEAEIARQKVHCSASEEDQRLRELRKWRQQLLNVEVDNERR